MHKKLNLGRFEVLGKAIESLGDKLLNKEFLWVSDPTIKPSDRQAHAEKLSVLIGDEERQGFIRCDVFSDEIERYVREDNAGNYIKSAWGSVENFQKYRGMEFNLEDDILNIQANLSSSQVAANNQESPGSKDFYKKLLSEINNHSEYFTAVANALDYHAQASDHVADFIESVMSEDNVTLNQSPKTKGGMPNYRAVAIASLADSSVPYTDPMQMIQHKIQNHLVEKGVVDPTMMHHIQTAFDGVTDDLDAIYLPKDALDYFRAMQRNLETNAGTCRAIATAIDTFVVRVNEELNRTFAPNQR